MRGREASILKPRVERFLAGSMCRESRGKGQERQGSRIPRQGAEGGEAREAPGATDHRSLQIEGFGGGLERGFRRPNIWKAAPAGERGEGERRRNKI